MKKLTEEIIEIVISLRELQGLINTDFIHCHCEEDTEVARKYCEKKGGKYESEYPSGYRIGEGLKIFDFPGTEDTRNKEVSDSLPNNSDLRLEKKEGNGDG